MIIRRSKESDYKGIKKLVGRYPKQLVQKHLPKVGSFFVAEDKGNIVGCCALEVYSRRIAEIRSLAVAKRWQGKGIGSQLVEACLKQARKRKVYEVFAITGKIKMLSRFGFGVFSSEKFAVFKILKKS
ncbi:MAG: GNAT family N-acetyltransferase [Patescibacteria group bacterium]